MAQDRMMTSEDKWRSLHPAMKAFNIFIAAAILAGVATAITTKRSEPNGNSTPSAASTSLESRAFASFSKADASLKCTPAIEARVNRPATIVYNRLDATFVDDGENARFTITGTAQNAFGATAPFRAHCYFKDGEIASVDVSEG